MSKIKRYPKLEVHFSFGSRKGSDFHLVRESFDKHGPFDVYAPSMLEQATTEYKSYVKLLNRQIDNERIYGEQDEFNIFRVTLFGQQKWNFWVERPSLLVAPLDYFQREDFLSLHEKSRKQYKTAIHLCKSGFINEAIESMKQSMQAHAEMESYREHNISKNLKHFDRLLCEIFPQLHEKNAVRIFIRLEHPRSLAYYHAQKACAGNPDISLSSSYDTRYFFFGPYDQYARVKSLGRKDTLPIKERAMDCLVEAVFSSCYDWTESVEYKIPIEMKSLEKASFKDKFDILKKNAAPSEQESTEAWAKAIREQMWKFHSPGAINSLKKLFEQHDSSRYLPQAKKKFYQYVQDDPEAQQLSVTKTLDEQIRGLPEGLAQLIVTFAHLSVEMQTQFPRFLFQTEKTDRNKYDEAIAKLDGWTNRTLCDIFLKTGLVRKIYSEELKVPIEGPSTAPYTITLDPLDGSSNIESKNLFGSILGIFRGDLPQKGRNMAAAAFILYGPAHTLVYSAGDGVHEFIKYYWEDGSVKFLQRHEYLEIPRKPSVFGVGATPLDWKEGFAGFIDYLHQSKLKVRYAGSFVADFSQILHHGGFFSYPSTAKNPLGKLRLTYECNPLSFILENAGGATWDGSTGSILDADYEDVDTRIPIYMGNKELIEKLKEMMPPR